MGPAGLALGALVATGIFGDLDVAPAVFAQTQVEAGTAPREPGGPPESTLQTEFRPGIGLRIRTPRSETILRLEPRAFYRTPNLLGLERPLFLLRGDAQHELRVSERIDWNSDAAVTYGELEYTSAELAFQTLAQGLNRPVLRLFQLNAASGPTYQLSERHTLALSLSVSHVRAFETENSVTFPRASSIGGTMTNTWELDPRSTLGVPISYQHYLVDPGPNASFLSAGLDYSRQLTHRTRFSAEGSAGLSKGTDEPAWSLLPGGLLAIDQVLYERRGGTVSSRASIAVDSPYDPTTGRVQPTGRFESAWSARSREGWSVSLSASAMAALASPEEPLAGAAQGVTPATTEARARATVAKDLRRGLRLSGGARYSTRLAQPDAGPIEFVDQQTFLFVAFTAALGLAREDEADWAL